MSMNNSVVVVHKDRKSREIKTYVDVEGHGAAMSLQDFISLLVEHYGSPATTMTRAGLLDGLQRAMDLALYEMKSKTKEVAAINMEPKV